MNKIYAFFIVACLVCFNSAMAANGFCPVDKPARSTDSVCHSCNEEDPFNVDGFIGNCTTICPNRQISGDNCVLPCPADKPIRAENGKCYGCSEGVSFSPKSPIIIDANDMIPAKERPNADCSLCPGYSGKYTCAPENFTCPTGTTKMEFPSFEMDRDETTLKIPNNCVPCDVPYAFGNGKDTEESCGKCPNRKIYRRWAGSGNSDCVLKQCPADRPLRDSSGNCWPCDTKKEISIEGDFECSVCPNRSFLDGACGLTCPADKPMKLRIINDLECVACDDPRGIFLHYPNDEMLRLCPNRERFKEYKESEAIISQLKTCPADKPIRTKDGSCISCNSGLSFELTNADRVQVDKNFSYGRETKCPLCPNMVYGGMRCSYKVCPADKPLAKNNNGGDDCVSCDIDEIITYTTADNCAKCQNRQFKVTDEKSGRGVCTKACPTDKPLMDDKGSCYACDDPKSFQTVNACSVCPNRIEIKGKDRTMCARQCPTSHPIMDSRGQCRSCDERSIEVLNTDSCALCPNRTVAGDYTKQCVTCSADKPLLHAKHGSCLACSEIKEVPIPESWNGKNVCPDNRIVKDNMSILTVCPPEYPLRDKNGKCLSCDEENYDSRLADVTGVEENCKACPKRQVESGLCIVPCPADKPIRDQYGKCYACDAKEYGFLQTIYMKPEFADTCKVCDNRKILRRSKESVECVDKNHR